MPGRIAGTVLLAAWALLAGCATPRPAPAAATYVLLRHAEKASDDARDPSLNEAGRERVAHLVRRLHDEPLVAVYASTFRRAQQTAAPVADDHGLAVTSYDAAQPATAVAAMLRREHPAGRVLVVGHSNTIPPLAQALCRCAIGPTDDGEYGRRITITVLADGRVTVDDRREP